MPTDKSPLYGLTAPTLADPWGLGAQRLRQLRDELETALARPHACLAASAVQSIPNSAYTVVTYGTVVAQRNLTVNAAAGTITATRAGAYLVAGTIVYTANATGFRYAALDVNGTHEAIGSSVASSGPGMTAPSVSRIVKLAVGDVVDLRAYQNSGAALNTGSPFALTNLSVTYLGA